MPNGLAPSWNAVTGAKALEPMLALDASFAGPHGNVPPSVPRAAFSHSSPFGNRLLAQVANARASARVTFTTGSSGLFAEKLVGKAWPVVEQNCAYARFDTSVLSM